MSAANVTPITVSATAAYWIPKITATWRSSVASIIETGRMLVQAKADCPHGEFGALLNGLPFSDRTAQCLMRIAEHTALSNPHSCADLPASWRTLSELARIPAERWAEAEPEIDGDLTVQKAKALADRMLCDEQFQTAVAFFDTLPVATDTSETTAAETVVETAVVTGASVSCIKARLTALRKLARKARLDTDMRARAVALTEIDRELGRIRDALHGCRCGGNRA